MTALHCDDCGKVTVPDASELASPLVEPEHEYFMVLDAVWAESGKGDGPLCVTGLERRVGRHLGRFDFAPHTVSAFLNDQMTARVSHPRSVRRRGPTGRCGRE